MQTHMPREIRKLQPRMEVVGDVFHFLRDVECVVSHVIMSLSARIQLKRVSIMESKVTSTFIVRK